MRSAHATGKPPCTSIRKFANRLGYAPYCYGLYGVKYIDLVSLDATRVAKRTLLDLGVVRPTVMVCMVLNI